MKTTAISISMALLLSLGAWVGCEQVNPEEREAVRDALVDVEGATELAQPGPCGKQGAELGSADCPRKNDCPLRGAEGCECPHKDDCPALRGEECPMAGQGGCPKAARGGCPKAADEEALPPCARNRKVEPEEDR